MVTRVHLYLLVWGQKEWSLSMGHALNSGQKAEEKKKVRVGEEHEKNMGVLWSR